MPASYDPGVDIRSEAEIEAYLDNVRRVIARCVTTMPSHGDYVAAHCAAAGV